jgi:hypothetical protein
VGIQIVQVFRGSEATQNSTIRLQSDKALCIFPSLEQSSEQQGRDGIAHPRLQRGPHESEAAPHLAASKNTCAKNTSRCTSGTGLLRGSLTHGFIIFDKIPRILFMRKFWHNGKPWQAQDGSNRCPGLLPQFCL